MTPIGEKISTNNTIIPENRNGIFAFPLELLKDSRIFYRRKHTLRRCCTDSALSHSGAEPGDGGGLAGTRPMVRLGGGLARVQARGSGQRDAAAAGDGTGLLGHPRGRVPVAGLEPFAAAAHGLGADPCPVDGGGSGGRCRRPGHVRVDDSYGAVHPANRNRCSLCYGRRAALADLSAGDDGDGIHDRPSGGRKRRARGFG